MTLLEDLTNVKDAPTSVQVGIGAIFLVAGAATMYLTGRRNNLTPGQSIGAKPVSPTPVQPDYLPRSINAVAQELDDSYEGIEIVASVEDLVKCGPQNYTGVLADATGQVPFFINLDDVTYDYMQDAQALLLLRNSHKTKTPFLLQGRYDSDSQLFEVMSLAGDYLGRHFNLGVKSNDHN